MAHKKFNCYVWQCKTCKKANEKRTEKYPMAKAKLDFYNQNYKYLNEQRLKYWKAIKEVWTLGNCHSKREQAELLAKYGLGVFYNWRCNKIDYEIDLIQIDKQLKVRI